MTWSELHRGRSEGRRFGTPISNQVLLELDAHDWELYNQLYINCKLAASIDLPHSVLNLYGTEGLSCGYDGGSPVAAEEYTDEFRFTGTIKHVTPSTQAGQLCN